MPRVSTTRSQRAGAAPHASLLPLPFGTTARSWAAAARSSALASSTLAGEAA